MAKLLQQPGQFIFMLVFLIVVQFSNAQQISKELYNVLPPKLKPADKHQITTGEKRKILMNTALYFSQAIQPERFFFVSSIVTF